MAMKKKGAAKGGVRKMRGGSKVVKERLAAKRSAATKNKIENDRTKAKNASIRDMGKFDSPSAKKRRAADAKAFAAEQKRLADKRKNKLVKFLENPNALKIASEKQVKKREKHNAYKFILTLT